MANQTTDRSLCDTTISSHAIATFVFCLNGITTGIAHPPTKKAKVTVEYKCGTCVMTNKCTDVGESWVEIEAILILSYVLQKATHY